MVVEVTDPVETRFRSGSDEIVAAIHAPDTAGPHPAVVLAHGFGATRAGRLDLYAKRFQRAGILAVVFDYRHFGKSGGEPRQFLSIRRQLQDWHTALAFTRGRSDVDATRVALWGTSFSGGHVVRVAAEDGTVAAVVAQVPFMDGVVTVSKLPPLSIVKASVLGMADLLKGALGGDPLNMPLVARPGCAAGMALDEAVEGVPRLYGDEPWENLVCARIGLAVPLYRPIRWARRVRCPLLVQAGERDILTPPGPARRAARAAPAGEFRSYPVGHFDFYFGEWFEVVVDEQVTFLRKHLGIDPAPTYEEGERWASG